MLKVGTRKQVFEGKFVKTGGGLRKKDLMKNKNGKIISRKMSQLSKNRIKNMKGGAVILSTV